jgi:hypothetical protein
MNVQLVRRDAAMRYLGRWLIIGPLLVFTMMGVIASIRFRSGPGAEATSVDTVLMMLTLWIPSAIYMGAGAYERRCSRFDMELPVPSRDIWLAHTVAIACAGLAVLAFTATVMAIVGALAVRIIGLFPAVYPSFTVGLALRVAAVVLLGVSLSQSVRPELERVPRGRRLVWSILGGVIVLGGVVAALGFLPLAAALLPLALAWVFARRTYVRLPDAMLITGLEPSWFDGRRGREGRSPVGAPVPRDAAEWNTLIKRRGPLRRAWIMALTVYRSTTKVPLAPIVGIPVLVAAGYTMAGAFGEAIRGDDAIRFSMLFIIAYALLSFSGLPPRRLFRLDAFPISRRFVFAVSSLPLVVFLGLGYGTGRVVADRVEASREIICYCELDGHYYLSLPLRNGAIARAGNVPEATSPWGESHKLWSAQVWSGVPVVVHSRFSTPPGSSREFVALQISKAVTAVYGEELDPLTISERYLTVDAGGRVLPVDGALTLRRDHPEWRVRPHGPVFPMMMLMVCGLWLIAMWIYLGTLRVGYSERQRKGAFWWGMVVLMGLHVSQFVALFTELTNHWLLSGFAMITIAALTERVPGGSAMVWVLCAAILFSLYRIAERRFVAVESSPGDDMRVELIQRPIGASVEDGAYAR